MLNDARPQGMRPYVLPTQEETLEFIGRLIHSIDNDRGDRPRWAELQLYKILNSAGQEMWLLYTIGHTMVYHRLNSPCNKGIALPVTDFPERAEDPEGLEPCTFCLPPDWQDVPPDTELELEVTWYTYTPCATPEKVLDALRRKPQCIDCGHKPHENEPCWCGCEEYTEAPRPLSVPGRRLIEQVRHLDKEIAQAAARTVRF